MVTPRDSRPIGLLVKIFPKLSETFILEEVLGLERLGANLRLYTLAEPTDQVVHSAVALVRAKPVRVPAALREDPLGFATRHLRLLARHPLRYAVQFAQAIARGRAGWRDFARAGWLAGQMRDDGVEHLHTHFISTPADVARVASRLSGLPFSISAHAKDIYLSDAADLRRKLHAARFTVTCTDFNCKTLRQIAPEASIHRMYHGIDHQAFHPRHRVALSLVPLILSVGRLREKKGLDTLILACALLRQRGQPFRCEIVGYGEEHDRLAAQIRRLKLDDQVSLVGKLTREQLIERYARAAVYVQPSRVAADGDRDGIPNVLLEAMAMSLPVVATRVSGIPELVVHGQSGLLVEPDDAAALSAAMAGLLDDAALGRRLGLAARQCVTESFDNDHNLRLVCQLLALHDEPAAHAACGAAA
jgi:glycosyltransferase involved in cell wall biosynthesis